MSVKRCRMCASDKPVEEFRWKNKEQGLRHTWCKPCVRKRQKELYCPDHQKDLEARAVLVRQQKVLDGELPPSHKVCSDCKQKKPFANYRWRDRSRNLKVKRCSECDTAWRSKDYQDKTDSYRRRINQLHTELRAIVVEEKKHPCMDCGVCYPPYVMDFDHRDPTQKVSKISNLMRWGSKDKLLIELEKCDLVCANCHRERTHNTRRPLEK